MTRRRLTRNCQKNCYSGTAYVCLQRIRFASAGLTQLGAGCPRRDETSVLTIERETGISDTFVLFDNKINLLYKRFILRRFVTLVFEIYYRIFTP